jgi:hypothetical protein
MESDLPLTMKYVDKFLIFPMVTYTPGYDKLSRSYDFSSIDRAAGFLC